MPAKIESNGKSSDDMDLDSKEEKQKGPLEERTLIKKHHNTKLKENELWYPVSFKWWRMWCDYTKFEEKDDALPESDEVWDGVRPGEIDNSELQDHHPLSMKRDLQEGLHYILVHWEVWGRLHKWYGGGPAFDRKVIVQGGGKGTQKQTSVDMYPIYFKYCWVDNSSENGAPDLEKISDIAVARSKNFQNIVDKFIKEETDSKKKEPEIRLWYQAKQEPKSSPQNGNTQNDDNSQNEEVADSDTTDVESSQQSQEQESNGHDENLAEESQSSTNDESKGVDEGTKDGYVWKLAKSEELSKPMEAWSFEPGELFMLEKKPSDKMWIRNAIKQNWKDFEVGDTIDAKDSAKKWYQSEVLDVKEDKSQIFVHYIGWPSKWDEWIDTSEVAQRVAKQYTHTTGPYQQKNRGGYSSSSSSWSWSSSEKGTPLERGAVGLRNLGNTCFMNSTLQCLSSTPRLTKYFLDGVYAREINADNPLGRGGKIAESWGTLIKDLWCGQYRIVAPRQLKDEIGKFAPRFLGYQQQDSSELLSFLLDGLHEDLNRVLEKPVTESKESNGRPDAEVAGEAWETYKKRNDSVIVDYMQGQLKSKVVCPVCDRISITFDPYMFLSVPLPTIKDKIQIVTLISADPSKKPKVYGPKVEKLGAVKTLKKALAEVSGGNASQFVVCDIWNNRVYRQIKDKANISEIRPNDHIFVYEVPPPPQPEDDAAGDDNEEDKKVDEGIHIQVFNSRYEENPHYHRNSKYSKEFIAKEFGVPVVINLPSKREVSHQEIRENIRRAIAPFVKPSEDPEQNAEDPYEIRMMDRTGRACLTCPYSQSCDGCTLPDDDKPFDTREGKCVFAISWKDGDRYDEDCLHPDTVERHKSAPKELDKSYGGAQKAPPVDLADCLDCFTTEETLTEENAWYCSKCKEFRCATKKMDLWSVPDILVIHLKRFQYTRAFRDKINTLVNFPLKDLDLSPWIVNNDHGSSMYNLYAVSNHMGGLGGGHYTAYAENLQDGKWYNLDDSHVSEMGNPEDSVSPSAYVLYYKRVGMSNDVLPTTTEVVDEELQQSAPAVLSV